MPKQKDPRPYLANNTTRLVHSTDSDRPECEPRESDNVGYGDALEPLTAQGFIPCPYCLPDAIKR